MDIKINVLLSLLPSILTFAFGVSLGIEINYILVFCAIVFVSFLIINSDFLSKIAEENKERRIEAQKEYEEEEAIRRRARLEEEGRLEAREEHREFKRNNFW